MLINWGEKIFSRFFSSILLWLYAAAAEGRKIYIDCPQLKLDTVKSSLSKAEPSCFHSNRSIFLWVSSQVFVQLYIAAIHQHTHTSALQHVLVHTRWLLSTHYVPAAFF